jgi:predicted metalloprotease with PDZ domain
VKRKLVLGFVLCTLVGGFVVSTGAQTIALKKRVDVSSSKKGWLGVAIQDITSEKEKEMGLKSGHRGALVSDVTKKSPADSAGIKEKDIIVQFGEETISDASDLQKAVADTKPGTKVSVEVLRKGDKKTIEVVIGKQKSGGNIMITSPRGFNGLELFSGARNAQGMALRQLNDQLAKYFDVPEGTGVLVWEVEKGSAAEKAGINAGDVITVIGKKKIKVLRDVSRALGIYDEGEKAEIEIMRKGARKTVSVEVAEGSEGEGYQYWFNEGPFRNRNESMMFNVPDVNVEVPDIDVETAHPDMDHLRIEMNDLREHLQNQSKELREKIQKEVQSHISVRISRNI